MTSQGAEVAILAQGRDGASAIWGLVPSQVLQFHAFIYLRQQTWLERP